MQKKLIVDFYAVRVILYADISISLPTYVNWTLHLPNEGVTLTDERKEKPTGNNISATFVSVNS